MPTVITVPVGERTKSIKFGAAYSPAMTFNPDKNAFYQCAGVLIGMDLTVDTGPTPHEITVDPGAFIQRGIIVTIGAAQVLQFPDPLPGATLYLVAENANEVHGSNVTLQFTTTPAADSAIIAQWDDPITTTVFTEPIKVSIKELRDAIESVTQLKIVVEHQVATGGQTLFTLPANKAYIVGSNKLAVFRNGKKLEIGVDYTEPSSTTVNYIHGAVNGDFFEFVVIVSAQPITSLALNDLTDVSDDLANAIKDTGVLRVSPATPANPLVTQADLDDAVAVALSTQVAKVTALRVASGGNFSTSSGSFVAVPGTSVPFTQGSLGPIAVHVGATMAIGSFQPGVALAVRLDGSTDYPLTANQETTPGSGNAVSAMNCSGVTFIDNIPAGAHTIELVIKNLGGVSFSTWVSRSADYPVNVIVHHL